MTALGLLLGLGGTLIVSRLLQHQLYDTGSYDPAVLALAAATLGSMALLACWLPARRAARSDPITALRSD
jgi:ABC-type antimicrobial peptide transport system permease subunit